MKPTIETLADSLIPFPRRLRLPLGSETVFVLKRSLNAFDRASSPKDLFCIAEEWGHSLDAGLEGKYSHLQQETILEMQALRLHQPECTPKVRSYFAQDNPHRNNRFSSWEALFQDSSLRHKARVYHPRSLISSQDISALIFAECYSDFSQQCPEYVLPGSEIYLKVLPEAANDPAFLNALQQLAQNTEIESDFLLNRRLDVQTKCHKLEGTTQNYFAKRIALTDLVSTDYEVGKAELIRSKGIDFPRPIGTVVVNKCPYVIFEYLERAISLNGLNSAYRSNSRMKKELIRQMETIYETVGALVRKMMDRGIYEHDLKTRNFMAQFDPSYCLTRVWKIDCEATILRPWKLHPEERERMFSALFKELYPKEKKYFWKGYQRRNRQK